MLRVEEANCADCGVQWFSTCYGVKSESGQSMTVYWVIGTIGRPIGLTSFYADQPTFLKRQRVS